MRFVKLLLFFLSFLALFLIYGAKSSAVFACNTTPGAYNDRILSGTCNPACFGNWMRGVTYTYDPPPGSPPGTPDVPCNQTEYFPTEAACEAASPGSTINPCPAQCDPNANNPSCTCAGGGISATDYCGNGSIGSPPYWCQGFNCGYDCNSNTNIPFCQQMTRGQGAGAFSTQQECTNFCRVGYNCSNGACIREFNGQYGSLGECRADPSCALPTPAPNPMFRCVNNSCTRDDTNGTFTENTCGQAAGGPGCNPPAAGSWVCDSSFGTCGCRPDPSCAAGNSAGCCPNGANTSFQCCHRIWNNCPAGGGGSQVCGTVFGPGSNVCSNGESRACPSAAPVTTTTNTGPCGPGCGGNPSSCSLSSCGEAGCLPNGQSHTCNGSQVVCNNTCLVPTGGPGPGNGSGPGNGTGPCLGNGAPGCASGGTCCSGLTCTGSGVCTIPRPNRPCDPLGYVSGSPANGTRGLPPNVTLTWDTNEDRARGACSNSGRNFVLEWGRCPTNSYDPATCIREGTSNGSTSNNTCSSAPSYPVNFPGNPFPLTSLSQGWHYWNVIVNCNCHWCETGAPPVQNGFWMFEVEPRPNPPTLICQPGTSDIHDICDQSAGSPTGYGGGRDGSGSVLRYHLSALDGGPADARQPFSNHRYDITDLTTGSPLVPIYGPNNGANAPFTVDGRLFLTSGHRYRWTVVTVDNANPPLSNPNSLPAVNGPWTFLYDISNPLVNIVGINGCFDTTTPGLTLPNPINILTNDPPVGGEASNIRSVTAQAFNDSTGGTPVVGSNQDLMGSGNCTWSGGPGVGNGSCNYNSSWAVPNGSIYRIVITSTDNAGNIGTNTARFTNKVLCIGPWLQTTSGDVHSNDKVNTPGGPL